MKTLHVVFLILVLGLSGCAHPGYQRGYVGYSSGYTSGYGMHTYDDYPVRSYYQPQGVMHYERHYVAPSYPHRHDDHDDWRGRDRSGSEHRPGGPQQRWDMDRSSSPRKSLDRAWDARAKSRQSNSESRRSWQPERESRGSKFR